MILDSSALVAIVLEEPEFPFFIEQIASASSKMMSSASFLETAIVLSRKKGPDATVILEQFLEQAEIGVVELTLQQAQLALDAYQRFGKGMRHPAQLNILDCCTYALAFERKQPVLFKESDFDKTDIACIKP